MGTTLTGKRVQNTYDSLLKLSDNDNLTGTAKVVGDGLGNDSPIYLSTSQVGIGVTPSYQFQTSGNAKIGANLIVGGNLTVNGSTTIVDSTIVAIGDNMIEMAKDNVSNTMDIGWYGTIVESGTKYVGTYYDAGSGVTTPTFYIGLGTTEPSSTAAWTVKGKIVIGQIDSTGGTFSGQITIPETPTADGHAASKKYVDDSIEGADTARRVTITVKNTETVALSAGTVVHAHPTAPVPSGNIVQVKKADYDTASLMPAIAILNEDLDAAGGTNDEGEAIMFGFINGIDTSSFSAGDELYVGNDGSLTNSKPLLTTQLIQKIAVVMKVDATNGSIEVFGAGRSNDVPNEVDRDLSIAGTLKVDDEIQVEADSGYGRLEIGGPDGGYIDLKTPFSDDYDLRIITNSSGSEFTGSGDFNINAGNTLTLTLDGTTQNATFTNDITLSNGNALRWTSDDVRIEGTTLGDKIQFYVGGSEILKLEQSGTLATFAGDLTVSGGDIILGGTGRIQGIDTITDGTDAVNKNYVDDNTVDGSGTAGTLPKWTDSDTLGDSIVSSHSTTGINVRDSDSSTLASIRIGGNNASGGRLFFEYNGDSSYIDCYGGHGSTERYRDLDIVARNLSLKGNGNLGLYVDTNGNVGIGSDSITLAGSGFKGLHIKNTSAGSSIVLTNQNSYDSYIYTGTSDSDLYFENVGDFVIRPGQSEKARITSTGSATFTGTSTSGIFNVLKLKNPINAAGTGHGSSIILHSTTDSNRGVAIASSSDSNYAVDNSMIFYTSSSSTLIQALKLDSSQNATFVGAISANKRAVITTDGTYAYGLNINSGDQSHARIRITNTGSGGETYSIMVGTHGVSNAGFAIRNETDSTTPLQFDTNDNATFIGQVHIDSKPNSGLAYNVLIDIGSAGDGTIGYQTVDQLAANLAVSSSSNWVKSGNDIYNTNSGIVQILDENGGTAKLQVRNFSTSATGSFNGNYMCEFRSAYTAGGYNGALLVHTQEANDSRPVMAVSDSNGIFATFVNGKVGFGVATSPDETLHLKLTTGDPRIKLETGGGGDPGIIFQSANNRTGEMFFQDGSTSARFSYDHAATAFKMYAHNQTVVDFYLSETTAYFPTQDIGIGLTNPGYKLEVTDIGADAINVNASTDFTGIRWSSTAHTYSWRVGGGTFFIYDVNNAIQRVTIDSAGRFYIGGTSDYGGKFIVEQGGNTSGIVVNNTNTTPPTLYLRDAGGAGYSEIQANNDLYLNASAIGIGTASPSAKIEVVGSNGTNIFRGNFGGSADVFIGFDNANPYLVLQDNNNVTTHLFQSNVNNYIVGSNLGIGDTNPQYAKLQIRTASAIGYTATSFINGANLRLATGGTAGTNVTTGVTFGIGGAAEAYIGAVQNSSGYADVVFQTYHAGYGERVRILSNGYFQIYYGFLAYNFGEIRSDTASLYFENAANNNYWRLKRSSNNFVIDYYNGSTTADKLMIHANGDLHADSDVIAYSTTISDERLKDNVVTIDKALDKVKQLRGVEYVWNKGSRKGKKDLGVIAQNVEKVLPEIVHEKQMELIDGETYKTVDYEKLTAVLIESVKELSAKVEALENKKCNCNCK